MGSTEGGWWPSEAEGEPSGQSQGGGSQRRSQPRQQSRPAPAAQPARRPAPSTDLVITEDNKAELMELAGGISEKQLAVIMRNYMPGGASLEEFKQFLTESHAMGLDPRAMEVQAIRFGRDTDPVQTFPTVAGRTARAIESGNFAGMEEPEFSNDGITWTSYWLDDVPPKLGRIRVHRHDWKVPGTVVLKFGEWDRSKDGAQGFMWRKRPLHMFANTLRRHAYKQAFALTNRDRPRLTEGGTYDPSAEKWSDDMRKAAYAAANQLGLDDDDRHELTGGKSWANLTESEGRILLRALDQMMVDSDEVPVEGEVEEEPESEAEVVEPDVSDPAAAEHEWSEGLPSEQSQWAGLWELAGKLGWDKGEAHEQAGVESFKDLSARTADQLIYKWTQWAENLERAKAHEAELTTTCWATVKTPVGVFQCSRRGPHGDDEHEFDQLVKQDDAPAPEQPAAAETTPVPAAPPTVKPVADQDGASPTTAAEWQIFGKSVGLGLPDLKEIILERYRCRSLGRVPQDSQAGAWLRDEATKRGDLLRDWTAFAEELGFRVASLEAILRESDADARLWTTPMDGEAGAALVEEAMRRSPKQSQGKLT